MAFDDLSFGGDEEEEELVEEERPNRSFMIGAIALAAVFLIGICAVVGLILWPRLSGQQAAQVSPNELTNNYNMTMAAQTATSALLTQQAPVGVTTEAPTTPAEVVVTTPPSEIVTPTVEGLTPTGEGGPIPAGEGTPTREGAPLIVTGTVTGTSFIENGEPTPTRMQIVIGDETGIGGPEGELPDTGISAETGLVGVGLLAVALVVVVIVVRRLRLT